MGENPDRELPLSAQIEGLLFVAAEPVSAGDLGEALQVSPSLIEAGMKELEMTLEARGLRLQRHGGHFQLTTAPVLAESIEKFLGLEIRGHLSRPALETLAIIAYQQPITHPQIDAVRGVNSDSMLKGLLAKGLIYEAGRAQGPGRPILYVTTPEFLQLLGLNSIEDLPPVEIAETGVGHDEVLKG